MMHVCVTIKIVDVLQKLGSRAGSYVSFVRRCVLYVGQVHRSALTWWIDVKATKSFHCNNLPFSVFHNATAAASTRGYVLTRSPLCPRFFDFSP